MDLCCAQVNQITAPSDKIEQTSNLSYLREGITVLFEPPKKINISFYRCDNKYHLDNVLDMYNNENLIGVCLLSGEELRVYNIAITGSHIESTLLKKRTIKLPNKQKKGGQSAVRFARNADIVRNDYVNKYAEDIVSSYMSENNTKCNVTKIIIAGYGFMPDDVINSQLFQQYLKKYLYKKISINTIDDVTAIKIIKDLSNNLSDDLAKNVDNEILTFVNENPDIVGFGRNECMSYIESNNAIKLYLSKNMTDQHTKNILKEFPQLEVIESLSSQLELYGGWLCIKKYSTY